VLYDEHPKPAWIDALQISKLWKPRSSADLQNWAAQFSEAWFSGEDAANSLPDSCSRAPAL
jgi:hypothetical protein